MRLLIIDTNYIGTDGITNVIRNLFCGMDKTDMQTDIVVINQPGDAFQAMFEAEGGHVYVLPRNIKHPFRYVHTLRRVIKQGRYDAVHVHGSSATLAFEMTAAWLAGCKVRIAHSHNTTCVYKGIHRLLTPLFRLLCTHRLACGVEAGKWLYGKAPDAVVNNGVDTARFAFAQEPRMRLREQYGILDEQKLIVHVGIFTERKNQSFLLDVMTHLDPTYKLILIGEGGAYLKAVEKKAVDLGIEDRVIFAGVTDRVPDYLSASDFMALPSLFEGLPLTLIEAQANGLSCIVSDRVTQEVDKTGNVLFLSLDNGAKCWAEAIQRLELPADRNRASEDAIEKIKACGYDIQTSAAWLKNYYCNAAQKVR